MRSISNADIFKLHIPVHRKVFDQIHLIYWTSSRGIFLLLSWGGNSSVLNVQQNFFSFKLVLRISNFCNSFYWTMDLRQIELLFCYLISSRKLSSRHSVEQTICAIYDDVGRYSSSSKQQQVDNQQSYLNAKSNPYSFFSGQKMVRFLKRKMRTASRNTSIPGQPAMSYYQHIEILHWVI